MRCRFPLWILLSALPTVVLAQDRPIRALTPELVPIWQKHAVVADGATNPSAIPYGVAMERAFLEFGPERQLGESVFRQQVRNRFTATEADVQRIGEIADGARSFATALRTDAAEKTDQICAEIVAAPFDTLNALDIAKRLTAVEVEQADRLTAFYSSALTKISPATRASLEAFVNTAVRPKLRWGHDLIGLATEVPMAFISHRQESCQRRLDTPIEQRTWRVEMIPQALPDNGR
jgi:hypothetical protein